MTTATIKSGGIGKLAADLYAQGGPESEELGPNEWRRGAVRRIIRAPVEIERQDRHAVRAHTLNACPDSLCVLSRVRLDARERVRVRLTHGQWHSATVTHCTGTVGGFKIGLV